MMLIRTGECVGDKREENECEWLSAKWQDPVQLLLFFNIRKQFKGKIGHFIGFILKLLTNLKKLIHIELMIFFLRKKVIYSCQADDHFSLACTYSSPPSPYFTP